MAMELDITVRKLSERLLVAIDIFKGRLDHLGIISSSIKGGMVVGCEKVKSNIIDFNKFVKCNWISI